MLFHLYAFGNIFPLKVGLLSFMFKTQKYIIEYRHKIISYESKMTLMPKNALLPLHLCLL